MQFRNTARTPFFLSFLVIYGLINACTPTASGDVSPKKEVEFEVLSQEAPPGGGGKDPITFAIRGTQPTDEIPNDLPQAAIDVLANEIETQSSALYIVIYLGEKSSTGFQVNIDSMVLENDKLLVTYSIQRPDPQAGAGLALTYPYVIARLADGNITADEVVFVES